MLRRALLIVGAAAILLGLILGLLVHPLFLDAALGGLVLVLGLTLEARRYGRRGAGGRWVMTEEKFIDPTTGHLMQVRFDPSSGERDYVDLGPAPKNG